jgi:O-methyltransferase
MHAEARYLDLLIKVLTGTTANKWDPALDHAPRENIWTLNPPDHLIQLSMAVSIAITQGISGDFMECGVWRGGSSIFFRALIEALSIPNRTIFAADSFEGTPAFSDEYREDYNWQWPYRQAELPEVFSVEDVVEQFDYFKLYDPQVVLLKGLFNQLRYSEYPALISVLKIDAGNYEGTSQALEAMYPRVALGGFVMVDEYYSPRTHVMVQRAVDDYLRRHNADDENIQRIPGENAMGVIWQKNKVVL